LATDAFKEFVKLIYIEKNITLFKNIVQLPLPKNIQCWIKTDLVGVYDFLELSKVDEKGKSLTVKAMKSRLVNHLATNQFDKIRIDSYRSQGKKAKEVSYESVLHTIWLNKVPKYWPPSDFQIRNMFGRAVLSIMLFSIPTSFPEKSALNSFGYIVRDGLTFNLKPTSNKEKSVHLLLSSVFKRPKRVKSVKIKRLGGRTKAMDTKRRKKSIILIE